MENLIYVEAYKTHIFSSNGEVGYESLTKHKFPFICILTLTFIPGPETQGELRTNQKISKRSE